MRVRLPLLRVAAKQLPSTGSMTDCLRQGGLPQSIVADFSTGLGIPPCPSVAIHGLFHPGAAWPQPERGVGEQGAEIGHAGKQNGGRTRNSGTAFPRRHRIFAGNRYPRLTPGLSALRPFRTLAALIHCHAFDQYDWSMSATALDFSEHHAAVGDGTAFALGVDDQRVDVHFRDFRVIGHHFGNA